MVLIDISGSMGSRLDAEGLLRIGAVKGFFEAFSDKTIAYGYNHTVSVIFFESDIELLSDFTNDFMLFK